MNDKLTHEQAYAAMFDFIEQIFRRTKSDDLAALLGSMSMTADGLPADPALSEEWLKSVEKAKRQEVDTGLGLTK